MNLKNLNRGNISKPINLQATPITQYITGIIDWTWAELDILDRKLIVLIIMNHDFHVDGFVVNKIGRGLFQINGRMKEVQLVYQA